MRTVTSELLGIRIPNPFWYSPAEVWALRKEHILFVMAWMDFLKEGKYPPEHRESGYVGGGMSTRNQQCSFNKPIELLAEVEERLKSFGSTGADLAYTIRHQWTNGQMSNYFEVTQDEMGVLNRIRGFNRPEVTSGDTSNNSST